MRRCVREGPTLAPSRPSLRIPRRGVIRTLCTVRIMKACRLHGELAGEPVRTMQDRGELEDVEVVDVAHTATLARPAGAHLVTDAEALVGAERLRHRVRLAAITGAEQEPGLDPQRCRSRTVLGEC